MEFYLQHLQETVAVQSQHLHDVQMVCLMVKLSQDTMTLDVAQISLGMNQMDEKIVDVSVNMVVSPAPMGSSLRLLTILVMDILKDHVDKTIQYKKITKIPTSRWDFLRTIVHNQTLSIIIVSSNSYKDIFLY